MAVIHYSGTVSGAETFDSEDIVTFIANANITGSITKTDALAMTIGMATGVIVTVSGTGYVDIWGDRGDEWVIFNSNSLTPQVSDWGYFNFTGSSANNTMRWVVVKNCDFGIVLQGLAPAEGQFQYIIADNIANGLIFSNSASGTNYISDCGANRAGNATKSGAATDIWSRLTFMNMKTGSLLACTKTMTLNDIVSINSPNGFKIAPASGNTITVNRSYSKAGNAKINDSDCDGTLVMNNSIIEGFSISLRNFGTGQIQLSIVDCLLALGVNEGLFGQNANAFTLNNVYIAGSNGADRDLFDNDDTIPDSTSTPPQYKNVQAITDARDTKNFAGIFSSINPDVSVDNKLTVEATSDTVCKAKIIMTTIEGDYDHANVISSDWDAPDVIIDGVPWPCSVTDWGESGKKHGKDKTLVSPSVAAGDYYYKLIGIDPVGRKFESVEQGPVTIAGGGLQVHSGMTGGMRG